MELRARVPAGMWADLQAIYRDPPRHYHTIDHVAEVARHYDEVAAAIGWREPRPVLLAVLYHDAIYRAGRPDNERASADAAAEAIARWLPEATGEVARVRELIELTARHGQLTPGEVDRDAALFLDCDMAILGAPPAEYDAYAAGVAAEYAAVVPAPVWRAGRRRFLEGLLARERIFLSDWFRDRYEERARRSVAAELDRL